MPDTDLENSLPNSELQTAQTTNCVSDTSCCGGDSLDSHNHASSERIDAAGEPCPIPLMWQEVRENFLKDSESWEIVRGPHRLYGRTIGEGPALYFLNNFAATAELFSLTIWLLKDDFRCIVFDTTTDDRRAAHQAKPSMGEFADDLFSVADKHGSDRFSVYGAGFGAAVALQACLNHPNRIDRLILQHGFASRRLSIFERLLARMCLRSVQVLDRLPQRRRFQAVNHKPWFPPFDPSRFDFLVESTGELPLRDLARRAMAVHAFDVTERVGAIMSPVVLIRTEGEGRLAEESQIRLEKLLSDPKIEWMHSAGQHPYLTHPHRVAKVIRNQFEVSLQTT